MLALPADLSELITFDSTSGTVLSREGKRLEFKQDFSAADFSDYTKALAAFANASGGVIMFGVSNKPRMIVGTKDMTDEADWANRLRDEFDPEIPFHIREYKIGGAKLYVVGVNASQHKPVICRKTRTKVMEKKGEKKDVVILQEGTIYYRYAGQSRPINFPELHTMLTERDEANSRKFMQTLQLVQKIGLDSAGVIDVSDPKPSILMSPETAKGLNFIKKAELVEEKGAPAYMVVGQVDLQHVVRAPLDDADKNLPTEAAKMISPVIKEVYGIPRISAQQLTLLLRQMKIDGDDVHCVYEKKMGRKYITRAGLKAVEDYIRQSPGPALQAFGSKAAKTTFLVKTMPSDGIFVPDEGAIHIGASLEALPKVST
ncbi:ATP-binding protein [Bradyrhizobium sp. 33ap4]|uniref:AlbA family DNA-binding domain-containing protein n=1 Tax=Bradyrhizobium sp. 33ap4 TaxID=3061630 RepID=UPI002930C1B4|nr:ATP-binding protein [Bradyrhizobium sp. 33ap4]